MNKKYKVILSILSCLIIIPIITVLLITTLVNPNQYKDTLTSIASTRLNREVSIQGDLEWSVYPLGIALQKFSIKNDPKFKEEYLLQADKAIVKLKTFSLLFGKVKVDNFYLNNAVLNLAKTKDGYTNWQTLLASDTDNNSSNNQAETQLSNTSTQSRNISAIGISKLVIQNASINWSEPGNNVSIDNFNLNISNLNFNNESFTTDGSLTTKLNDSGKTISNQFTLYSKIDSGFENINFNIKKLITKINGSSKPIEFTVTSDVKVNNVNKNITAAPITLLYKKIPITGKANIDYSAATPKTNGELSASRYNISKLTDSISGNMNLKLNFNTAGVDSQSLIKNLNGNLSVDMEKGKINGVNIDKLLALIKTNISVSPDEVIKKFENALNFITGILESVVGANQETAFNNLSANAVITNGVLNNNDLKLNTREMLVTGSGQVNLVSNNLNYTVIISDKDDTSNFSMPVTISGNLNDPSYSPGTPSGTLVTNSMNLFTDNIKKIPGVEKSLEKLQKPLKKLDKILGF